MFLLLRVFRKGDLTFRRKVCVKQISMVMGTYVNTQADSSSKHFYRAVAGPSIMLPIYKVLSNV